MTSAAVNKLTDLRLQIRQKIYNNDDYVQLLLNDIQDVLDCTSIFYNKENVRIDIKIKKTSMKKNDDYTHNVVYYYPLIEKAVSSFLEEPEINKELSDIENISEIKSYILFSMNITTLLDNLIRINL
jgi:hypothetical protein